MMKQGAWQVSLCLLPIYIYSHHSNIIPAINNKLQAINITEENKSRKEEHVDYLVGTSLFQEIFS